MRAAADHEYTIVNRNALLVTRHPIVVAASEFIDHRQTTSPDTRRAEELAAATCLPIAADDQLHNALFYLYWRDQKLTLRDQSTKNTVDICIDFCAGKHKHRLQFGGGYGQPLARAINAKANETDNTHKVCDATGGLGQDAFVFASLGCQVVILERSPIIYALLQDGIQRAQQDQEMVNIAQRMKVCPMDSRQLPGNWTEASLPATVYLDPMYPHTAKSAAAKKGMQTLQRLLPLEHQLSGGNPDPDAREEQSLLLSALQTATQRVAVKRPVKAPALPGPAPVGSIKSPNTRYDLYNAQDY